MYFNWIFGVFPLYVWLSFSGLSDAFKLVGLVDSGTFSNPFKLILLSLAYSLATIYVIRCGAFRYILRTSNVYMVFLYYVLLGFVFTLFPVKLFVNIVHYYGALIVAWSFVIFFAGQPQNLQKSLCVILLFICLANIAASVFVPGIGIYELTGRWQGFSGNPNTMAPICMVGFLTAFSLLINKSRYPKILICCCLIVFLIGLLGAFSATCLVLTFSASSFCWFLYQTNGLGGVKKAGLYLAGSIGVVFLAGIIWFFEEKFFSDSKYFFDFIGRDSTLTGRTTLWEYGYIVFSLKPEFGWSFDSLMSASSLLQSRFEFEYFQFHNGYIDILVKGGYIGLFLFVLILIRIYFGIKRRVSEPFKPYLLAMLLVMVGHNISESSFGRELHPMWFLFVLVYVLSVSNLFKIKAVD